MNDASTGPSAALEPGHTQAGSAPERSPAWTRAFGIVWVASSAVFVLLRLPWLDVSWGDEGIYLYQGRLLAEGALPYRDYFLAHPPLRLLLAALSEWLTGGPVLAKALCLAAGPAAGLLAGMAAIRVAPRAAVAVPVLLAFSALHVESAGYFVGANLAMVFVAGSAAAAAAGRWKTAGLVLALGTLQALYVGVALPGLAFFAASSRKLGAFGLGALVGGLPLVAVIAAAGRPGIEQVFVYHVAKVGVESAYPVGELLGALVADAFLLLLSVAAVALGRGGRRALALSALTSWGLVATYESLVRYYFLMALPLLAAGAAAGAEALAERSSRMRRAAVAAFLAASSLAAVPPMLDAISMRSQRVAEVEELAALAAAVEARLPPGGAIVGDGAFTPAVALLLGARITGNEVDTNSRRFETGSADVHALLDMAEEAGAALLLADHHGLQRLEPVRELAMHARRRNLGFWYGTGGFRLVLHVPPAAATTTAPLPIQALGCELGGGPGAMLMAALAAVDLERPARCLAASPDPEQALLRLHLDVWLGLLARLPSDKVEARETLARLGVDTLPDLPETSGPVDRAAALTRLAASPEWALEAHAALFLLALEARHPAHPSRARLVDALASAPGGPEGCPGAPRVPPEARASWRGWSALVGWWRAAEGRGPKILLLRFPPDRLCRLGAELLSPETDAERVPVRGHASAPPPPPPAPPGAEADPAATPQGKNARVPR